MIEKGTLHAGDGQYTLRFERRLAHPPEKVWRALTENKELTHWFPAAIDGAREPGARLRFRFDPAIGPPVDEEMRSMIAASQIEMRDDEKATSGKMRVYDPPRTLEYTWGDEVLRFELLPQASHTLLVFTHTFTDRSQAAPVGAGWHVGLEALAHLLDGAPAEPTTMAAFKALTTGYTQSFGS